MKLIIISGPSGSGKSTLSRKIMEKVKYGFVLNTDNYYKTGIISKILSKIINIYFDRKISFNYGLFKKDLEFIINNRRSTHEFIYDFKSKTINKSINKVSKINYLIIEGIFAREFLRTYLNHDYYFIEIVTNKDSCMNRVIYRDKNERGKSKKNAKKEFLKSWDFYYLKNKTKISKRNKKQIIFTEKSNINEIIEKIINLKI